MSNKTPDEIKEIILSNLRQHGPKSMHSIGVIPEVKFEPMRSITAAVRALQAESKIMSEGGLFSAETPVLIDPPALTAAILDLLERVQVLERRIGSITGIGGVL